MTPTPFATAARALCAALALMPLAATAADADTAAEIRALRARLDALEAQLAQERAAKPAPAAAPVAAKPAELKLGDTQFTWGGYVKLDALYSRFAEGEVAQGTGRDFYVPNSIPVGNGEGRDALDFHAKETRLFLKTETAVAGQKLGTHIEFDFIVNQGAGNERVTNAYNPGLRRAFVTYGSWLLGQEWSTFQNLGSLPETLDFVAFPSEGTVFVRQPQVRYTQGGLMLALENPETTLLTAPFNAAASGVTGAPAYVDTGDATLPDVVARYNFKLGGHEVALAGLLRQLKVKNAPAVSDERTSGGVSVSGKFMLGATDDFKFQLSAGDGIGRYIALATAPDAVLANGELDTVGVVAGYVAYKHQWQPGWRSTFTYSHLAADNPTSAGSGVTKTVQSGSANLLYSPVPKLTFGVEYRHAQREVESGADGALDRVQFSSKYAF